MNLLLIVKMNLDLSIIITKPNKKTKIMSKALKGDDRILNKIKALLDKAGSTDSLHEKEACMLKAQELMQNNQIEHSRVSSFESIRNDGVEEDEILYDENWEAYLLHFIAMNNFCQVVLKGKSRVGSDYEDLIDVKCESMIKPGDIKEKMAIIGEPTNVNMCLYLYSFFRNAILGLFVTSYQKFLSDNMVEELKLKLPKGHKDKFMVNYLNGCVHGVNDKMCQQKKLAELGSGELRSLFVIKNNNVLKYMAKNYPRLGRSNSANTGNSSSNAFNQGRSDGAGLSSHGSISNGNRGYIG